MVVSDFIAMHGGNLALIIPFIFIAIDVITGVTYAAINGDLSSAELRNGAGHKLGEIFGIVFAFVVDISLLSFMSVHFPILVPVAVYVIFSECVSIIENITLICPDMEDIFRPILRIVQNAKDKKVEELDQIGALEDLMEDGERRGA